MNDGAPRRGPFLCAKHPMSISNLGKNNLGVIGVKNKAEQDQKLASLTLYLICLFLIPSHIISAPLSVWVVRNQITSFEKIQNVVQVAHTVGVKRLYVQVVGRMDSYYSSEILPRAEALLDQPSDFDPLDLVLRLAKQHGIAVSAWMNVFYAWPFTSRPRDPTHVVNRYPEWITYDSSGRSLLQYRRGDGTVEGLFLDPGIPEVRNFVTAVAAEISKKYDVDEIHLDFIRYPYSTYGYNPISLKYFEEFFREYSKGRTLLETLDAFDKFRILQVNLTVQSIYRVVKANGKNLSAAVFANYASDAVKHRFQDWVAWLRYGYIDYVCLMAYSPYPSDVLAVARATMRNIGDLSRVRIGIGAMNMKRFPERIVEVGEALKTLRPNEIVVFSFEDLLDDRVREAVKAVAEVPSITQSEAEIKTVPPEIPTPGK